MRSLLTAAHRARGAAILLALIVSACRSTTTNPEGRSGSDDVVIAKLPPDAAGNAAPSVPKEEARVADASTEDGWLIVGEEKSPKYLPRAEVLAAMKKLPNRALLEHEETVEECSSMGGSHAFFRSVVPAHGVVHYGGHGVMLIHAFKKGELWVAAYDKVSPPESVKNPGFCVPDRTIDGRAIGMVRVATRAEGERLLNTLSR